MLRNNQKGGSGTNSQLYGLLLFQNVSVKHNINRKKTCIMFCLFIAAVFLLSGCGTVQEAEHEPTETLNKLVARVESQMKQEASETLHDQVAENIELITHAHEWENGVCTICGEVCNHEMHDLNAYCKVCGERVHHKYHDGQCKCGRYLFFYETLLPIEYYRPCSEQGTLTTVTQIGKLNETKEVEKQIEIYLPFGYTPDKKYDVMFLQGGLNHPYNACTTHEWLFTEPSLLGQSFILKDLYDNMIMRGDCEPMIIVAIDGYSKSDHLLRDRDAYEESAYFLRNTTYPYIIENYSTYAESTDIEDIRAARSHFGVGGFSNGAYMSYFGCLRDMLDICANYMPIAGSYESLRVANRINKAADKYQIEALYMADGGNSASSYDQTIYDYSVLIQLVPYLEEGKNAWFTTTVYDHDWETGSISFYNGLQVMFPNSD